MASENGTIFLIRHGETDLNQNGSYQGVKDDLGLNQKGIDQVKLLSEYFKQENICFHLCLSSTLNRSVESLNIIRLNSRLNCENIHSDLLREINFGRFDGLKKEDVVTSYPDYFRNNKHGYYIGFCEKFPEGESMLEVYKRVERLFNSIHLDPDKNYLITGHNGVNKMIRSIMLDLDPEECMNISHEYNEIVKISIKNKDFKIIKI